MWKFEKTARRSPHARFSPSMFVYKKFLGVIVGCPDGHYFKELTLLDQTLFYWRRVVRSTTNVVGDDLVVIGGGAACYAFGTKLCQLASAGVFKRQTYAKRERENFSC